MAKNPTTKLAEVNMIEIKESLLPALQETQGSLEMGSMLTIQAKPTEIKYLMLHLIKNAFY